MTLSDFIQQEVDKLVDDWSGFAQRSIPPARDLAPDELKDGAKILLLAAVADMKVEQDAGAQHDKSRGERPNNSPKVTETAQAHARHRFQQGFTLGQMVSEYRALRASVIRHWIEVAGPEAEGAVTDVVRFGESMDQGLSESIAWYAGKVDESRGLLLGVLGHDMRNPLGAVATSAQYLLQSGSLNVGQMKAVARIMRSTTGLLKMVDDLLDFTHTALGTVLPVAPAATDVAELCRDVVEELAALHPERALEIKSTGDATGHWDPARISQMLSNLVANAIQHGARDMPVAVTVIGSTDGVELRVHNSGLPIAPDARRTLFEPLRQSPRAGEDRHLGSSGLGLGLYIAREIAIAHGGSIELESTEADGTTFTARLPRKARIERRRPQN